MSTPRSPRERRSARTRAAAAERPTAEDGAQSLPARLLDTPGIARLVPGLSPHVLHRVVEHSGLDETLPLLSLATPAQLRGVLDLDLWRPRSPGLDESFDAHRFGEWLDTMAEAGESVAADLLARMPQGLVVSALSHVIRVYDPATLAAPVERDADTGGHRVDSQFTTDIGGYHVIAHTDAPWDAVVSALGGLLARHASFFHGVMRGCRRLSNQHFERDGLDNLLDQTSQAWLDEYNQRLERREHQGYVTPADARAFLRAARDLTVGASAPAPDPTWLAWYGALLVSTDQPLDTAHATVKSGSPADDDSSRGDTRPPSGASASGAVAHQQPSSHSEADDVMAAAGLLELLAAEGVLSVAPRAMLSAGDDTVTRLTAFHASMRYVRARDHIVFEQRSHELTFLANVMTAGCRVHQRALSPTEASDAAVAVCNLGLAHWPRSWSPAGADGGACPPADVLVEHSLVAAFQVGWQTLYAQVCLHAAQSLSDSLGQFTVSDRDLQSGLKRLRRELKDHLKTGDPWRVESGLDVLASIDTPAWAVLAGLIAEFPVMHALLLTTPGERVLAVDAQKFAYLSEPDDIVVVTRFLDSLTERLTS